MNVFLSVYIKKCKRSGAGLRLFDVCNQKKRQVIWYTYLRNDAVQSGSKALAQYSFSGRSLPQGDSFLTPPLQ